MNLAPTLEWSIRFPRVFLYQKTENALVGYCLALLCDDNFSRSDRTPICNTQTEICSIIKQSKKAFDEGALYVVVSFSLRDVNEA